jgi:hypothetical protein
MWCPAGVLPGGGGCTDKFLTPQDLINDMDASNPNTPGLGFYEQHGIIYFTADPGGAFVLTPGAGTELQTSDYNTLKVYDLTLQGGWNGLNEGSGFALSGQTDFGANRVRIGAVDNPWAGNITINNISISGVTGGTTTANNTGLVVYTAGAINIDSVISQNNAANGAILDNTSSAPDSSDNSVIVQNSSFDGNTLNGLRVASNGNITLSGLIAQGNTRNGALLNNTTGTGNITTSSSTLSGNGIRGLDVLSNGNITLIGVLANENVSSGTRLDNWSGSGSLSVSNSSFTGNGVDGLDAYSNGDITLANVIASFNAEIGASLVNDSGEGNVTVSNSTFNSNTSIQGQGQNLGLEIISNGDVTLDMVTANDNTGANGSSIVGGGVLVQNSIFNNNDNGLYLEADEAEVVCSQFNNNAAYGIDGLNVLVLFTLDDVTFSANGSGDYAGSPFVTTGGCSVDEGGGEEGGGEEGGGEEGGGEGEEVEGEEGGGESSSSGPAEIIPLTGLALNIVSVAGSENVNLNCEAFSGTKLILPNGDSLILPCPIRDDGTLMAQAQDGLPGQLDDQFEFLSAMNTGVIRDGQALSMVDTGMIVEFVIPDGQNAENLAILHWDGSEWAEFPGNVTADGYFAVTTNFTGVFVLVTK